MRPGREKREKRSCFPGKGCLIDFKIEEKRHGKFLHLKWTKWGLRKVKARIKKSKLVCQSNRQQKNK